MSKDFQIFHDFYIQMNFNTKKIDRQKRKKFYRVEDFFWKNQKNCLDKKSSVFGSYETFSTKKEYKNAIIENGIYNSFGAFHEIWLLGW